MLEQLQQIPAYKTLHVLCSVSAKGQMKAIYYVVCLVYGRTPLWGVWNVKNGRFQHFAANKPQIEEMHPNLTWRKVMARWQLADDADSKAEERRKVLSVELEKAAPFLRVIEGGAA